MAARSLSRVFSNTTLFRSFLRPVAAFPNTQLSPRSFSTPDYSLQGNNFGADGNHWFIKVKKPDDNLTRDQIIDSYIKLLAKVIGSEADARMKIYSVSTRHYYAIGAHIDEEIGSKLRELPEVLAVREDTYINWDEKDYGGEPFIDGRPVPYDRKYHAAYWHMQEAMVPLPPRMDNHKDAKIRATDSEIPNNDAGTKWSIPRAWLSQVGAWWKGPSP